MQNSLANYMGSMLVVFSMGTSLSAQSLAESVSATWINNLGINNPSSAVESNDLAFSITSYSIGSNLEVIGTGGGAGPCANHALSKYRPAANVSGATEGYDVIYSVTPSKGLKFKPTKVTFNTLRYGTDGGFIQVKYQIGNGEEINLGDAVKPNRNNNVNGCTNFSQDINIEEITEAFTIRVYLYGLANKEIGIGDFVITGEVNGEIVNVNKYTLTTSASPVEGGYITVSPFAPSYDESSEITLKATKAFGFKFANWTDLIAGSELSKDATYKFNIESDSDIQAVFEQINTYELAYSVSGGANSYQVAYSTSPTVVDGKNMYEEDSNVSLTASSNPIIKFTNWSTGETSATVAFDMTKDYNVVANYSSVDFIAGWDFHVKGSEGRIADFSGNIDNEATALVLRNEAGSVVSWLDKSHDYAGGYEGLSAAVNWKPIADRYYYQTTINAKDFTNIKVTSKMLCNYNAYKTQKLEYSLDGNSFVTIASIDLETSKVWYDLEAAIPADANNKESVIIRWIPDYSSPLVGTTATNDGTSIAAIYITADAEIFNDGVAPVLKSSVPTNGYVGASASGQVVLTFDERVKIAEGTVATLGDKSLSPIVSGSSITFPYTALSYNTAYTFTLPANTVADLSGNTMTEQIKFTFTTMERSDVEKAMYDFVVDGTAGNTFQDAVKAANAFQADNRFRIFVKDGEYYLGDAITTITASNVSIIGESAEGTVLYNKPTVEGISTTATIQLAGKNVYMQDITLKNAYDYVGTTGRAVALQDKGDKNIFKNIKLLSFQDTYYSNNNSMRAYFEDCQINGTVDFICGGGDIVFKRNLIFLEDRSGNVITAPAGTGDWGYVFMDCTIDGYASNQGSYTLGRPWNNDPRCVFLNTTMKVIPAAAGWSDMSKEVVPGLFAEYKSVTASGSAVDCSSRKTQYTAGTVTYDPVLSDTDAAKFTVENILSGNDQWLPELATEQEAPLTIAIEKNIISWTDSKYALVYAVVKDGKIVEFTMDNQYMIPSEITTAQYTVRAANEMGGLGINSNAINYSATGIDSNIDSATVVSTEYFTVDGIRLSSPAKGINIIRTTYNNGSVEVKKQLIK